MELWQPFCIFMVLHLTNSEMVVETEMFSIPLTPNIFNWTYQEFDKQYVYRASMLGKPDLPPWLRYIYSVRHHAGFIFGTPPKGQESITVVLSIIKVLIQHHLRKQKSMSASGMLIKNILPTNLSMQIEVIALNRQDYETRHLVLPVQVSRKERVAAYEVELKIDNLNVEDLLDEHRMEKLKQIFRRKLWKESTEELYTTFLVSAIELGARLPLKPNEGDGVVVRLGSTAVHSPELTALREEVRPLARLQRCPRDFKRTTVERLFRDAGFALDWCNFKLMETLHVTDKMAQPSNPLGASEESKAAPSKRSAAWRAPRRARLPTRSYARDLLLAIALPLLMMMLSVAALTAVLCLHFVNGGGSRSKLVKSETEHEVRPDVADNNSSKSMGASPNNSLTRSYSPKSQTNLAGNYNRPQPPPYLPSNTNSLVLRRSTHADRTDPSAHNASTPELNRTNLALEESLKLLNEANITNGGYIDDLNIVNDHILLDCGLIKKPIIDMNDGSEDYVPIQPDICAGFALNGQIVGNGILKSNGF